ncbi:MAG: YIP1 family protein [Anaerolineales bacterium]|nr:YIP1 family protein [Anaerolineales bacterium]
MKEKNDFRDPFSFDGETYDQQLFGPDMGFMPQTNYTWSEVWMMATTQPSVATFQKIIRDPKASLDRAFSWIAGVSVFSAILGIIGQVIWTAILGSSNYYNYSSFYANNSTSNNVMFNPSFSAGYSLGSSICCLPFQIIVTLIMLVIMVGISHITARVLGGNGVFEKSFYAFAAAYAPLMLVTSVVNLVPILGTCIGFFILLYVAYVVTIAMKAVHNIGWGEAFISAIAPIMLFFMVFCVCIALFSAALMGAAA